MSNKKQRNKHKNKPTRKQMLKMEKKLKEVLGFTEPPEEIPHMPNYYKKTLKEEFAERRKKLEDGK